MLYAGEDIKFIARRIMICAAEDVGNADPQALILAVAAAQAAERIGLPEAQIILAEAVTYVASAPNLQDSHYKGAAKLGHGQGYLYAHDYPGNYVKQQYLPDGMEDISFYHPTENGYERRIKEHLRELKK